MDGGLIKKNSITIIHVILFVIIMMANLFDQIQNGQSIIGRSIYTLPFLILIVLCILFRKKYKFNAYLFLSMSFLSLMTTSEPGNLTGIIFLIYSLYIFQTFKMNIVIIIITAIGLASKIFFGFTPMQVFSTSLGYVYCIIVYYILIHPKKPNIYTGLDEITREIIEYKMAGWSTKAVADKICLSTDAVQKRISRACDKYDAGNLAQLVYKLMKKGYIST